MGSKGMGRTGYFQGFQTKRSHGCFSVISKFGPYLISTFLGLFFICFWKANPSEVSHRLVLGASLGGVHLGGAFRKIREVPCSTLEARKRVICFF